MALISFLSNIGSLQAQRRLSEVTESLSSTAEKLSSGQRINRASDDAAGLAVADALRTQSRLFTGAQRNLNDGISLLNVIDGTLSSQSTILTRLSELAEQSANGVYSETQRRSLDNEYRTLLKEFSRLAESTSFNNLKPLLGRRSNGVSSLLVQAGVDGTLNSLLRINSSDTGKFSGILTPSMMCSNEPMGEIDLIDFDFFAAAIANNDLSDYRGAYLTEIRASDGSTREIAIMAMDYSDDGTFGSTYTGGNPTVTFNVAARNETTGRWETVAGLDNVVGGPWSFNLQFSLATGQSLQSSVNRTFSFLDGETAELALDVSALEFRLNGSTGTAIDFTNIQTAGFSLAALDVTRSRLQSINQIRGEIGAVMSRLNIAASLAAVSREGTSAAESRIRDVDVASASAKYTADQILQNVAASILSQANNQPRILLDILQNS